MNRPMNLRHFVGTGALVAGGFLGGCVIIDGPITYGDTGGAGTTTTTTVGGGGAGTTTSSTTTSSSTSSTTSSSTTGTGGSGACATAQSDEFDGTSPNPCWIELDPLLFGTHPTIAVGGDLIMTPASLAENGWYEGTHGPLFFQNVTGDFTFVAGVYATTTGATAPTRLYNIAGLLAREPSATSQNERWALIDIGKQGGIPEDDNVDFGVMIKSTSGSMTDKIGTATPTSFHAALALCRRGNDISLLYRVYMQPTDGPFTVGHTITGWPGMSSTLQVGLVTGTWVEMPDVVARFTYARFGGPGTPADCLQAFQQIAGQGP
jgi:hypothetical protein